MTEVAFYHLQRLPLERALPKLLEKTLAAGKRALVVTGSTARSEAMADVLWTYDQNAWLPHGTARDGNPEEQPVWIAETDTPANGATFLFLSDGAASENVAAFERCFDLFDGNDPVAVQAARDRWKVCKDAGHELAYWQQEGTGAWKKKG